MATNVLEIDPQRLWDSLERSAEIGRFRDVGLRRLALSGEDREMRDQFVAWAKDAGCTVEIDWPGVPLLEGVRALAQRGTGADSPPDGVARG